MAPPAPCFIEVRAARPIHNWLEYHSHSWTHWPQISRSTHNGESVMIRFLSQTIAWTCRIRSESAMPYLFPASYYLTGSGCISLGRMAFNNIIVIFFWNPPLILKWNSYMCRWGFPEAGNQFLGRTPVATHPLSRFLNFETWTRIWGFHLAWYSIVL